MGGNVSYVSREVLTDDEASSWVGRPRQQMFTQQYTAHRLMVYKLYFKSWLICLILLSPCVPVKTGVGFHLYASRPRETGSND